MKVCLILWLHIRYLKCTAWHSGKRFLQYFICLSIQSSPAKQWSSAPVTRNRSNRLAHSPQCWFAGHHLWSYARMRVTKLIFLLPLPPVAVNTTESCTYRILLELKYVPIISTVANTNIQRSFQELKLCSIFHHNCNMPSERLISSDIYL
jgi:hypothetical protein